MAELIESEFCYQGAPKKPCIQNFPGVLEGVDGWIRFGPKVKGVPPPRTEQHGNIVLSHHADEVGLYTKQKERDFEHVSSLLHYKEQVTGTLVHAICAQDDECELNPLPGSPSYSLSKLEKETIELVELGPWDYFLVKISGPIWTGVSFVGICGGIITAEHYGAWAARSGVRVCKSFKKTE